MAVFEYQAINTKGKEIKGFIDAESQKAARAKLKEKGIFPTSLFESTKQEVKSGLKKNFLNINWQTYQTVNLGDLSISTRQLATLVNAGIPLVEALKALSDQLDSEKLSRIYSEVSELVNEGTSLAQALGKFPRVFPKVFVNMVAAGEKSGSLDIVLDRLANLLESQADLRRKVRSAMIYPVLMLMLCVGVVILLLTVIIPQIVSTFQQNGKILPLPTQIVIGMSEFLQTKWWVLVILIALVSTGFKKFYATPKGRNYIDKLKLTLPLVGGINLKYSTALISRTLSTMLASGVELLSAMAIVRNVVSNVLIQKALDNAAIGVREGKSLSLELKKAQIFPKLLIHLVGVGEKTGELEQMLDRVAKSYESEVEALLSGLTKIIEPLLILIIAAIVGVIVLSVILPMLEMGDMMM